MCGLGFIGWLIGLAYLFLLGMALTFLLGHWIKKLLSDEPPPDDQSSPQSRTD